MAAHSTPKDTTFGKILFDPDHERQVGELLHQKLAKEQLSVRPGPGGRKLTYIESCRAIQFANQAFGFNGWSCEIVECKEEYRMNRHDKWHVLFSSKVRIQLKDGTYHEDVGFGQSDGQKDLGAALETAKKACISDARKRALRCFGELLGNSCYDKDHLREVNSIQTKPKFNLPRDRPERFPGNVPMNGKSSLNSHDVSSIAEKKNPAHAIQRTSVAEGNARPSSRTASYATGSSKKSNGASRGRGSGAHAPPQAPQKRELSFEIEKNENTPALPKTKSEHQEPKSLRADVQVPSCAYDVADLSFSQFDYDPNQPNPKRQR